MTRPSITKPLKFTLDHAPVPEGLEDVVPALFRAAGSFVDMNFVRRDNRGLEVSEFEAVATSYHDQVPQQIVAAARSGSWGWPDAFKALGSMQYLGLNHGVLFVSQDPQQDLRVVRGRLDRFGVQVVCIPLGSDSAAVFTAAGFPPPPEDLVWLGSFSARMERNILRKLEELKTRDREKRGPAAVLNYLKSVNDKVFLVTDAGERLLQMIEAFNQDPRLSLGVARELDGHAFDTQSPGQSPSFAKGTDFTINASWYAEHRARLAIFKTAVDVCLEDRPLPSNLGTLGEGLEQIRGEPWFKLYPLCWQFVFWGLGGFILTNEMQSQELELIEKATGIPADQVPSALSSYQRLFPSPDGWFTDLSDSVKMINRFPVYFSGLGAAFRSQRYKTDQFDELGLHDALANRICGWNNIAIRFLIDTH
jgi:hypothetical protein